jgi:hypothetical protein
VSDAGGDVRWETYSSGAKLLRMKVESFRRVALRKGWRRLIGNDGQARVAIPLEAVERRSDNHPRFSDRYTGEDSARDIAPGVPYGAVGAEPHALKVLADALRVERERREAAEAEVRRIIEEADRRVTEARERAALAEGLAAGLQQGLQAAEAARIAAEGAAAEFRTRITAEADRTAEAERRAAQEGIRAAEAFVRAEGAITRAEAAESARQAFVTAPWWRRLMGRP